MALKRILGLALVCFSVTVSAAELNTHKQKYSYSLGLDLAQRLHDQGLNELDTDSFLMAMQDVFSGSTLQLNKNEQQEVLIAQQEAVEKKNKLIADKNSAAGKAFLAANKTRKGVVTLASGLQYLAEKPGSGESPIVTDSVRVHYHGTLPNGTVFDSSVTRGEPAEFALNRVISGFSEALTLMKPGAKWRVFVPSELGYGATGAGGEIAPHQTLIFDLELIKVLK